MKILITAWRSDMFGGLESYIRDLALGVERRGHSAVVWCDDFLKGQRPMEADGVRVLRSLDDLPFLPDVIHGHGGVETMLALSRLPTVPAIYHCHSAGLKSAAPRHPRILRYGAITPTLALRLAVEFGLDESTTDVILNSIDLTRFATVRTPPKKPARALFYNSRHRPDSATLAAIRQAALRCNVELDCIGRPFGRTIGHPERVLPRYDLVFASGRSAIDALACGCAVVVLSMTSCGELVRSENYERLRRANFSVPVNSAPPAVQRICAEIARYNADDCAKVTERLRQDADAVRMIEQMEGIYERVIAEHRDAPTDHLAEQRAVARFLRQIMPLLRLADEQRTDGAVPMSRDSASRGIAIPMSRLAS